MSGPVQRAGAWWQQRPDGSWLRWNEGNQAWEESSQGPPPEGPGAPSGGPPPGAQQDYQQQPGYQQPGYPPQTYPAGGPPQVPGELASVWARIGAVLLDFIIIAIPIAVVQGVLTGGFDTGGQASDFSTGPTTINGVLWALYFLITEATWGKSLGKLMVGLKVVNEDGSPIDWKGSGIRNALRLVDVSLCFLIGLITMIVNDRNQRLGDMAAKTLVLRGR